MIPQDFIQTLLDRVDIVDVIERYVPLKKAGANYQARCPFHNEKTPSFSVSPSKQFYHCFGCGAHGTAITFLMEHAGYGFVEAVKELAGRVGLTVPDDGRANQVEDGQRERQYALLEAAAQFYRAELKASPQAIDYLKRRGLTGETAARFGLGYAPDAWQGLARALSNYQDKALEEVGLVVSGEAGKRYDRFRHRVMFPIRNERGRVIAFGGRVLDTGEPKYLNSPETPLFHKGRELYGLHEARKAIQARGQAIVVEGYMDVVMLAQHGIENAVATLGTAITGDQVERLLRLSDAIVFAFDGDAAGRRAAWRALENSLPRVVDGKRLGFLFLPEGEDPDSFVRSRGRAAFERLCAEATPLSQFLLDAMLAKTDLESEEGKVRLIKLIEPHLSVMRRAPLLAASLRRQVAALAGQPLARSFRGGGRPAFRARGGQRKGGLPGPGQVLLQALLHDPQRLARIPGELLAAPVLEGSALRQVVERLRAEPQLRTARDIVESFRGQPIQAELEAAAAAMLLWDEAYDVEADFQKMLHTLSLQLSRQQTQGLGNKRPSQLSEEEKARIRAALQHAKGGP